MPDPKEPGPSLRDQFNEVAGKPSSENIFDLVERLKKEGDVSEAAEMVGKALERLGRALELADTSPVSGLPNARGFENRAHRIFAGALRSGDQVALVSVDLNKFKPINDTYGHDAGDVVLKVFGRELADSLRESDLAGHTGGDEFIVLMRARKDDTEFPGNALDRIREKMEGLQTRVRVLDEYVNIPLQASFGVAIMEGDDFERSYSDARALADKEMMIEKRAAGARETVILNSPPPSSP